MVALSTVATIIASQAMISGVFSLTRQAVQLGYFPRIRIIHTSSAVEGQIFVPEINALLCWACVGLVLAFKESSRLAAAYGIAVTATMAITSALFCLVAYTRWKWPAWKVLPLLVITRAFVHKSSRGNTASRFTSTRRCLAGVIFLAPDRTFRSDLTGCRKYRFTV